MKNKTTPNKYQYKDLLVKSKDQYANSKYEILLNWLKKKRVESILNTGCGSGELCLILAEKGYEVLGIDPDESYIKLANKNLGKLKTKNCVFQISSIEEFKSSEKFDAVIATDVLEHIENDKKAFELLASFTKKGGSVLCTVPAGQYLYGFHDEELGHFRRYSLKTFSEIVPQEVRSQEIRYFGITLIPIAFLFSRILRRSYPVSKSQDNQIVKVMLTLEKKIKPFSGTSLLFYGEKI